MSDSLRHFFERHGSMLVMVGVVIGILAYFLTVSVRPEGENVLKVKDTPVQVRIADTPELRTQGLSETERLLPLEGMLFVFPEDGFYSIWMKDMRFAIDVLWLSSDGTIIHALQTLTPESYPHVFTSTLPARYVLELPAGFMERYEVRVGDRVTL